MAKVVARNGVVKIGANTVAQVIGFSMDEAMTPIDDSDLNDQEMTYVAGDITRTAAVECMWDKADTTGQGAMDIGASVSLVLQREGDTSGDETLTMNALVTSKQTANAKGAMVTQNFGLQVSGAVTEGSVI